MYHIVSYKLKVLEPSYGVTIRYCRVCNGFTRVLFVNLKENRFTRNIIERIVSFRFGYLIFVTQKA